MPASNSPQSAAERREAQREALRQQRQSELRRQRSVRIVVISVVTVLALVIVAGAGYLIYRANQPAGPVAVPEGMSEDQPYLSVGAAEDSGAPVVEVQFDFMCPYCGQFDEVNAEDLQTLVDDEAATIRLVPRNFLDTASTTGDYSTRSANALVCVYEDDPANALPFSTLMFENQPAEQSAGLTDEEIWGYAQEAGASDAVQECMSSGTYEDWVDDVANPYGEETGGGTPYITIDGEEFGDWTTEGAFYDAVLAAGGSGASDAGGASDDGEG